MSTEDPTQNVYEDEQPSENTPETKKEKKTQEERCIFCQIKTNSYTKFQKCDHIICSICLFQELFRNHLKDISEDKEIIIKCSCDKGSLPRNNDNILNLLSEKREIDEQQMTEGADESTMCIMHPGKHCKFFCTDCKFSLCPDCIDSHQAKKNHNLVDHDSYMKKLKLSVETTPTILSTREQFMVSLDNSLSVLKEVVQNDLYNKLKLIDGIMESLAALRKYYETEFKNEITKEAKKIKILKLFYMNYFYEKEKLASTKNLRLVSFLNDIKDEFMGIKSVDSSAYDTKLNEIKNSIESLRKATSKKKLIEYNFNTIPHSFVQDCIISGVNEGEGVPNVVQLKDGKLVTASQDSKIKIWTEHEKERQFEFVNTHTISSSVGKVVCLLLLEDDNIVTSASNETSVKVWTVKGSSNNLIATLSRHSKPVRAMCNLQDGKFITGSSDLSIIIWHKSNQETYEALQVIQNNEKPITYLLGLKFQRFAAALDYGTVMIFGKPGIDFTKEEDEVSSLKSNYEKGQKLEAYIPDDYSSSTKDKTQSVTCMCESNNKTYLLTAGQFGIIVYKLITKGNNIGKYELIQKITGEDRININSIIEMKNHKIACSLKNRTIRFLQLVEENKVIYKENTKDQSDEVLHFEHGLYDLIQLKDGRLAASSTDKKIIIWKNRLLC